MLLIGGFEHTIKFFFDRGQFHKLHLYGLERCEEYQMNGVFSKPLAKVYSVGLEDYNAGKSCILFYFLVRCEELHPTDGRLGCKELVAQPAAVGSHFCSCE